MKLGSLIQNLGERATIEKLLNYTLDINLDKIGNYTDKSQKKSRKNIQKKKEQRRLGNKALKKYARRKTRVPAYTGQQMTGTFLDFENETQIEIEEITET